MKKNDLVEVTIESMGSAGEGIGKMDGYPLFVKDTFPGDKARVSLTKVKKTYAFARLVELLEPSPDREESRCAQHRRCGGCQIQGLSYEKQLLYKEEKVREDLKRRVVSPIPRWVRSWAWTSPTATAIRPSFHSERTRRAVS